MRNARSLVVFGLLLAACSSDRDSGFAEGRTGGGASSGNPGGTFAESDGGPAGTPSKPCVPNAANYDVPGNGCDDDGDGKVDNPPTCDTGLSPTGGAEDFAKSIGICTKASEKGYGFVSAKLGRGHGQSDPPPDEQHGILPKFGDVIRPREGVALGVLSTGYAREYNGDGKEPFGGTAVVGPLVSQPNGKAWTETSGGSGTAPPGFPKAADGCKQADSINDVISLSLELKAPPNASGVKFDFNFYSGEWPAYICSPFNDGFLAYLTAKGFNGGKPDNMSFDKNGNPVSVNNGFFDRCTPNVPTGCAPDSKKATSVCPGGVAELAGTGFGIDGNWCAAFLSSFAKSTNGGATGWLTSQAPVQPGETLTLEFMIWDTGDALLDSSVLIDNFSWTESAVAPSTDRPPK